MKTTYRRLNGFNIEVADSGDTANRRVSIFHSEIKAEQHNQIDHVPGSRTLVIGS